MLVSGMLVATRGWIFCEFCLFLPTHQNTRRQLGGLIIFFSYVENISQNILKTTKHEILLAFSGTLNSSFKASIVWRFGIDPGVICKYRPAMLLNVPILSNAFPFYPFGQFIFQYKRSLLYLILMLQQANMFVSHFCSSHRVEELISFKHQTLNTPTCSMWEATLFLFIFLCRGWLPSSFKI